MWKIRIHATYKNRYGAQVSHMCDNAFKVCEVFVRNFHMLWKVCANSSDMWQTRNVKNTVQQLTYADS